MHLRLLFLLSLTLLLSAQASAQLVIDLEDYPRPGDYVDPVSISTDADIVLVPAAGQDQTWDYSDLTLDRSRTTTYMAPGAETDSLLQGALQFCNCELAFQAFPIPARLYTGLDSIGWYDLGRTTEEVAYPIAAITGSPTDTLRFPALAQVYEGRRDNLLFPVAFGSQWSGSHIERTPFELSVAAFGLNRVPGLNSKTVITEREVIGSGQLFLPRDSMGNVGSAEVLLIRAKETTIDSVFLGGQPAPPTLLGAFGLTQGQTLVTTNYIFYRPGFEAPVAVIPEGSMSISYRPRAAQETTGVEENWLSELRQYPNPVAAGTAFSLETSQPLEAGNIEVLDLQGRSVLRQSFPPVAGGTALRVELPASLRTGLYVYRLSNTRGQLLWSGKLSVNR